MKTILVVDDDTTVLQAVTDIVQDAGYTVYTAKDGKEGLKQNSLYIPDIILTDIIMPDMEGIEFIKSIRKERKQVPIIVMSGHAIGMKYFHTAEIFGASAGLIKPFSRRELLETITKFSTASH